MKIKNILTLTIALSLIFIACKKVDPEEFYFRRPVFAGVSDSLMNSGEYNPVIQFNFGEIDSVNNAKYASDSIDIDGDGSIDFKFKARAQIIIGPPENYFDKMTSLLITPYNGYQIRYNNEYEYTPHGDFSTDWASVFEYGKEIQLSKKWKDASLYMWFASNGPLLSWGPWYNSSTEDRYLGIRLIKNNEEKFGWIRIRKTAHDDIAIVGYAIEK